ncbi:MAG: TIGR00730 family Rossman fold protein [Pseudomonadota bacterium]
MSNLKSVCVYCGSSDDVKGDYLRLATETGRTLASKGLRMVYGGGGVGLMGACARAAHGDGGDVLGIMPKFLLKKEMVFEEVEHRIVDDMHTRKQMMFDESDAFIVLPGGIGTLEEAVEMLSWSRLGLHAKPMAFLDEDGFWDPFFDLMDHIIEGRFTPEAFRRALIHTDTPEAAIEALQDSVIRLDAP